MADRVEWNNEMATGVEEIDVQHQRLMEIYNGFEDAAQQGKGWRQLDQLLADLIRYTADHFTFEEDYLEEQGYPDLTEHKRTHHQMKQKLERLRTEHQVNRRRVTKDMRTFLAFWLSQHILKHDMDYLPWLNGERSEAEATAEPVEEPVTNS